jgi:hypothetical protein
MNEAGGRGVNYNYPREKRVLKKNLLLAGIFCGFFPVTSGNPPSPDRIYTTFLLQGEISSTVIAHAKNHDLRD